MPRPARGEDAWRAGGLWRMRSDESPALREVRQRLEVGAFDGSRRHRQAALAMTRHQELLLRDGRVGEAREYNEQVRAVVESYEHRNDPRAVGGGCVVVTHDRNGRRLTAERDVPDEGGRTVRARVPVVRILHRSEL